MVTFTIPNVHVFTYLWYIVSSKRLSRSAECKIYYYTAIYIFWVTKHLDSNVWILWHFGSAIQSAIPIVDLVAATRYPILRHQWWQNTGDFKSMNADAFVWRNWGCNTSPYQSFYTTLEVIFMFRIPLH